MFRQNFNSPDILLDLDVKTINCFENDNVLYITYKYFKFRAFLMYFLHAHLSQHSKSGKKNTIFNLLFATMKRGLREQHGK